MGKKGFSRKMGIAASLAGALLLFSAATSNAQGQNKKDLEQKKKKLQKEIELTDQLLKETKISKKISLNQVITLNKKIGARQELIQTINNEIALMQRQIRSHSISVEITRQQLQALKKEYAKMIYYAYKNQDSHTRLMFIFSSSDFNQAYARVRYLQQYAEYRHRQAEKITQTQNDLNARIRELEIRKSEKQSLLVSEEEEKQNLAREKQEKEESLAELQDKEKQLKKDLDKKKKDAKKLQEAIERIIREEMEKHKPRPKPSDKGEKPSNKPVALTPEAKELSDNFAANKGKLPWPVLKGFIIERFGVHPHPVMKDVEISNNGVDISTTRGSLARALFEGEVTGVVTIPDYGKVIIVKHGEYYSVYSNLEEVYVKTGEKIKTKQNIGSVIHDTETGKTAIHLEIWKGQTKLNPEQWLFPESD